jgi:hypothetical protein
VDINSSAATVDVSLLKPGDPVRVGERPALFLYARGTAAVVRYPGERETRAVSLAKLTSAS